MDATNIAMKKVKYIVAYFAPASIIMATCYLVITGMPVKNTMIIENKSNSNIDRILLTSGESIIEINNLGQSSAYEVELEIFSSANYDMKLRLSEKEIYSERVGFNRSANYEWGLIYKPGGVRFFGRCHSNPWYISWIFGKQRTCASFVNWEESSIQFSRPTKCKKTNLSRDRVSFTCENDGKHRKIWKKT